MYPATNQLYTSYITTTGSSTSANWTIYPASVVAAPTPPQPTPQPDDPIAWLRRRVTEITDLVAA